MLLLVLLQRQMAERIDIVCAGVRLVPHKYVKASYQRGFEPSNTQKVVSVRGNARAQWQRRVAHEDGCMVEEIQVTLSFDNPGNTLLLRNRPLHWWVAQIDTADGNTLMIGSKDFPAKLETDGTDTDDTITLTTRKPI